MTKSCPKTSKNLSFPNVPPGRDPAKAVTSVGNPDTIIGPPIKTFGGDSFGITPNSSKPTLFSFGILPFVVGGLTDSINPCALTTLAFFIISLFFFLNHRKVMVILGGCFILGVFLTTFFLIMGLADPVRSSPLFFLVCRIIYFFIALIALGLGGMSLRDWWVCRKKIKSEDVLKMKFPVISEKLDQMVLKIFTDEKNAISLPFVGGLAGILAAFLMSIYPEQTYISMTVYAFNIQQQRMVAFLSLILYSFCFVFPLVFSLVFVVLSLQLKDFLTIVQRHWAAIKIICSAVFFAIGLGLIYAFL